MNNEQLSTKKESPKRLKLAGALLGAAILSGIGVEKFEGFQQSIHKNSEFTDFGKYEIGSHPEDLAKVLEKRGMTEKDITVYTVKGEQTAEEVAKDMGIYNWGEVGRELISQQINDPKSIERWTMHSGQTVVVPNDLFDK